MEQIYNFKIDGKEIGVSSDDGHNYHVSINGVYTGIIFPEFDDELSDGGTLWRTKDLIALNLVAEIGRQIEDEDM